MVILVHNDYKNKFYGTRVFTFVTIILLAGCLLYFTNTAYIILWTFPGPSLPQAKWLTVVRTVSDKFLSVALDADSIQNRWIRHNLSSSKLLELTSSLAPAYLRIGGNAADCLVFSGHYNNLRGNNSDLLPLLRNVSSYYYRPMKEFTMTGEDWDKINNFAHNAGLDLLFDVNVLLRNGSQWDSTNAEELIKFSDRQGYNVSWQLGNEPNSFRHKFHTSVSGSQLGRDFIALRKLLGAFPRYGNSLLVGPDVTRPINSSDIDNLELDESSTDFLRDFLKTGKHAVNAVTWHQYYVNGRVATVQDFIDPEILNVLYWQISAVQQVLSDTETHLPIWLTETSSAYGGGAPELSDRYVAGFMWLDKLGLSARLGLSIVVRQALYGGNYSLLDLVTLDPFPNYWISVLYKKLVGSRVLSFPLSRGALRLYAHCTSPHAGFSPGSITVFGMNLDNMESIFNLSILLQIEGSYDLLGYILLPEDRLQSKNVLLNGALLKLKENNMLPDFVPVIMNPEEVHMPSYSLAFFVLDKLNHSDCYI